MIIAEIPTAIIIIGLIAGKLKFGCVIVDDVIEVVDVVFVDTLVVDVVWEVVIEFVVVVVIEGIVVVVVVVEVEDEVVVVVSGL